MADCRVIDNGDVANIPRIVFMVLNSSIKYKATEIWFCHNPARGIEAFIASDRKKYQVDLEYAWEIVIDGKTEIGASLDRELFELAVEYFKQVSGMTMDTQKKDGRFTLRLSDNEEKTFRCSGEKDGDITAFKLILE